jgi:hypothetical protein
LKNKLSDKASNAHDNNNDDDSNSNSDDDDENIIELFLLFSALSSGLLAIY